MYPAVPLICAIVVVAVDILGVVLVASRKWEEGIRAGGAGSNMLSNDSRSLFTARRTSAKGEQRVAVYDCHDLSGGTRREKKGTLPGTGQIFINLCLVAKRS